MLVVSACRVAKQETYTVTTLRPPLPASALPDATPPPLLTPPLGLGGTLLLTPPAPSLPPLDTLPEGLGWLDELGLGGGVLTPGFELGGCEDSTGGVTVGPGGSLEPPGPEEPLGLGLLDEEGGWGSELTDGEGGTEVEMSGGTLLGDEAAGGWETEAVVDDEGREGEDVSVRDWEDMMTLVMGFAEKGGVRNVNRCGNC